MKKMKIARLRSTRIIGGPAKSILTFVQKSTQCDCLIITFARAADEINPLSRKAAALGARTEQLLMRSPLDLGCISRLAEILVSHGIEILHTHGYKENLIGYFAAKKAGIKTLAMVHGWTGHTFSVKAYEWLDKIILRFFDRVVIVSAFIRKDLLKAGISNERVEAVSNAIDIEAYDVAAVDPQRVRQEFGLSNATVLIGSIGRLSQEKGHRYLIEAAALLKKDFPAVQYILVGDGPEEAALKALVKAHHLQTQVVFAGRREDVNNFFAGMDLFVLPSLREVLPNVILEAFMFKTPVVATAVGGVPELIRPEQTGLLCPPGCARALAAQIRQMLTDRAAAKAMGAAGHVLMRQKFDAAARVRKIEEIYRALLK